MKKIIFPIYITINAFCAKGQIIENGDFTIGSNYINTTTCGTAHIIDGVTNWHVTHGTPNYDWFYGFPHTIYMQDIHGTSGEGIMGGYPFIAGETYIIHLGLRYGAGKTRLIATNMPPPVSPNMCVEECGHPGYFNGTPPVPASFSADINKEEVAIPPVLPVGDTIIMYTPVHDYSYLMLFPYDQATCYPNYTALIIDYVWITRLCKMDYYLPRPGTATPSLPLRGVYGYTEYLYAGSKHGTTLSVPLAIHPNRNTYFRARQQIVISENFVADVNSGSYFVAEIDPYICNDLPPEIDLLPGTYSKPSPTTANKIIRKDVEVSIYPNPNDGTFDITLPNTGSYDITVSNITGNVVYQTNVSGTNKQTMKMQDVAPGNYFVTISSRHFKQVKRIVIVK